MQRPLGLARVAAARLHPGRGLDEHRRILAVRLDLLRVERVHFRLQRRARGGLRLGIVRVGGNKPRAKNGGADGRQMTWKFA